MCLQQRNQPNSTQYYFRSRDEGFKFICKVNIHLSNRGGG